MYPDPNQNQVPNQVPPQPPNQTPYSIDYLNQIAPQEKKPGMNNRLFMMLAIGGIVLALIVGLFSLMSSGSGPTQKMQALATRLIAIETISKEAQKTIKSNDLRGANSSMNIFLTNANRDIVAPLSKNNVDVKKIDQNVTKAETKISTDLKKTLEDARLNAIFDRIYAREMAYQLDTIAALMKDIHSSTNSKSLNEFLTTTDTNLQPIKKQFYDYIAE